MFLNLYQFMKNSYFLLNNIFCHLEMSFQAWITLKFKYD